MDSGANRYVTNNFAALRNIKSVYSTVDMGNKNNVEIHKMRNLKASTVVDTVVRTISIGEVAYALEFTTSSLSLSCIRKKRLDVNFKTDNDIPEIGLVEAIEKTSGSIVMRAIEGKFGFFEML